MVRAIPLVKPTTMGYGIYLMMVPRWSTPNMMRNTPAISVAIVRPSNPYCWMMPYIIIMNAPVGPPICTFEPPKTEMSRPATMAVMIPFSGVTPEAIPKAMANGRATMPTMIPASRSVVKLLRS